jgi:hypothetical protein
MHETMIEGFRGMVDKSELRGDFVRAVGWIAGSYDPSDIGVRDAVSGMELECSVEAVERPDVSAFYKGAEGYLKSGWSVSFPRCSVAFLTVKGEPVLRILIAGSPDGVLRDGSGRPSVLVLDGFYEDPDEVRRYALLQEFKSNESYHKGKRTGSFIPSWAAARFASLLGCSSVDFVGASGVFQYCTAVDQVVYHHDDQEYAAMVYLTPDAPLRSGTDTFRSVRTGLFRRSSDKQVDSKSFNGNNFYDRYNMELVDSLANVYNRCVVFDAHLIHAAGGYFGSSKEDSRLFHLYFFNLIS